MPLSKSQGHQMGALLNCNVLECYARTPSRGAMLESTIAQTSCNPTAPGLRSERSANGSPMPSPGSLGDENFAFIVRNTPLVAIDIIIEDPDHRMLLGRRNNEPAKGYYFVPGGAIRKNEMIQGAFARILKAETGLHASIGGAKFIGVFEHFYDTNRFDDPEYGTHYVVLAYELRLTERPSVRLDSQHSDIRWLSGAEILSASDVHPNAKAYFASKRFA
jgi:colanic acid biosynthesis protein WcaH